MSSTSDLTPILTGLKNRRPDVTFRSGTVVAWNAETGENTITVAGSELTDLPTLIATEKLAIGVGDVVGILKIRTQMFVLGRIVLDEGSIVVRDPDGNITVRIRRTDGGGGEISTYHPNGTAHAYIGQLYNVETGQITGQGFLIQRDNGADVVNVSPLTPGGPTQIRMRDPNGELVFGTDPGGLLDRPHMDVPMYPLSSLGNSEVDSTAYTTVWMGRLLVTHPAVRVMVRCWTGSSVTQAAIRVLVGGETLGSSQAFAGGLDVKIVDYGVSDLPGGVNPYSWAAIELQLRRVSGSGSVFGMPYAVTKQGSE